jgi:hypothetical protein
MGSNTFMERCLSGEAVPQDDSTAVDHWHDGDDSRSLRNALGLTPEEYEEWVAGKVSFSALVERRRAG